VCYDRHRDWQKEVFAKAAAFGVVPRETQILEAHKMVH
jgi:hypothetical protein